MRHSGIRFTVGPYDNDMLYNQVPVMEAFAQVEKSLRNIESAKKENTLPHLDYQI